MHGVPDDLNLEVFEGSVLDYISLCRYIMILFFESEAVLSIEGKWDLLDSSGELLDSWEPGSAPIHEHGPLLVHKCVGRTVQGSAIDAPRSFSLQFEGGLTLRVSDIPGYEAFHIEPGDIHV